MTLLSKQAILSANDLTTVDISCPEWGGEVRIRSLTGTQRDAYGRSMIGPDGKTPILTNHSAKLVAVSVIGEDGTPQFTLDDVDALAAKSAAALGRVYEVAVKLNGMGADAVETAKGN